MNLKVVLTYLFSGATAMSAYGHGGGLNAEGCHHNRKTGDYHCHRPKLNRTDTPSKTTLRPQQPPTCFTGPRGGTYTITSSGRKNYNGC